MEKDNKKRLMIMKEVLEKYSDEDHRLTTSQIVKLLREKYNVQIHRTTVAKDIAELQEMSIDIQRYRSTHNEYFIGSRLFAVQLS